MVGDHLIISDISVKKKSFSKNSRGPPKMIKIWLSNETSNKMENAKTKQFFDHSNVFENFEKHYFMGYHDSLDLQISFLGSHGFRVDFRSIQFFIKSNPKTLKLVNISRDSEKKAKNTCDSYLTENVPEV
jgi:hypothetical protein